MPVLAIVPLLTSSPLTQIALFTVSSSHFALQYINNIILIQIVCKAISGFFVVSAQNCLQSTFNNIVIQMKKTNHEKGFWHHLHSNSVWGKDLSSDDTQISVIRSMVPEMKYVQIKNAQKCTSENLWAKFPLTNFGSPR